MPARQCVRVRRQQAEGAPCRFGGRGQQGDQRPGHSWDDPQRLPQIRPEARRRTRSGRSAGAGCPHHGLHADRRGEPPSRSGGDGGAVFTGWSSTASCSAPAPAPAPARCPWRDLPREYANRKTAHNRHRRWSLDGTWQKILDRLRAGGRPPAFDRGRHMYQATVDVTSIRIWLRDPHPNDRRDTHQITNRDSSTWQRRLSVS